MQLFYVSLAYTEYFVHPLTAGHSHPLPLHEVMASQQGSNDRCDFEVLHVDRSKHVFLSFLK